MMVFDRTHVKLILYVVSYSVLVFARFRRGIVRSDADTISRASLEITNVAALLFALGADYGAQGKPGVRYTFGRKRLHVLVALVMCVVVIVNCVLNLAEVLDDLSWIPDKDTMWEKKEINILQCAVGMVGLGLFRHVHHFRVKRAEHSNQKGVYLHGLATTLDAVVTLIISLIFSNQQTLCLVLNFFGTLTVGVVIVLYTIPLLKTTTLLLLHSTPSQADSNLDRRVCQLATVPGVRDCTDVHFWIETDVS